MIVYLARHAETNFNVLGLSNSNPDIDVHLTAKGVKQAQGIGLALRRAPLDVAFVSRLPRTLETAQYITKGRKIKTYQDERINDINMGYEGKPVALYHEALSGESDIWKARFNDGESLNASLEKVDSFLQDLRRQKTIYANVLIVSHFTVLQLMVSRIKSMPKKVALSIEIQQGTFTKLEF
jgi:broad specificity phosphatase PhoE